MFENAEKEYSDIFDKQRPIHDGDAFEARHPKMSREARAKIFAPFAALKGFEEAIEETNSNFVQQQK